MWVYLSLKAAVTRIVDLVHTSEICTGGSLKYKTTRILETPITFNPHMNIQFFSLE